MSIGNVVHRSILLDGWFPLFYKLVVEDIHLLVVQSRYAHAEDHIQLGNILGKVGYRCQWVFQYMYRILCIHFHQFLLDI